MDKALKLILPILLFSSCYVLGGQRILAPIMQNGTPAGGLCTGGCILDAISTQPFAAYSLRRLRGAYAGKSVQIERQSDSTSLDIGFTATGDWDNSAVNTFCTGTACFVTKWYDQSANGFDMTSVSAFASLPVAFVSGVGIITKGTHSKPVLVMHTNQLSSATQTASNSVFYVNAVTAIERVDGFQNKNPSMFSRGGTNGWGVGMQDNVGSRMNANGFSSWTSWTSTYNVLDFDLSVAVWRSNGSTIFTTSSLVASTASTSWATTGGGTNWISFATGSENGYVSEEMFFGASVSSGDQTSIRTNQYSYYGITGT